VLLGGCALPLPPPADPRWLRATIGPGAERLEGELERERAVLDAVAGQGRPDYVWAPTPHDLVLVYLAADRALRFAGPPGARRLADVFEPIPDEWLDPLASADREEVRGRRIDFAARAKAPPAGWCARADAPPPASRACQREPAVQALLAEVRRKVLDAWQAPRPDHGGERTIVRFRIGSAGELLERCVLGATSPTAAEAVLAAFDAALPVPPLRGSATCAAGASLLALLELATD
jgi:hypothetical protein